MSSLHAAGAPGYANRYKYGEGDPYDMRHAKPQNRTELWRSKLRSRCHEDTSLITRQPKPVARRGRLVSFIRHAKSSEELARVVGKSKLTDVEQDEAARACLRSYLQNGAFNRQATLTFEWGGSSPEENFTLARDLLFEFLWRVARRFHGHGLARIAPIDLVDFIAVPECWSKIGARVPLHYHMAISVPSHAVDWFDRPFKGAAMSWQRLTWHAVTLRSGMHVQNIFDLDRLAGYNSKHSDNEMCFLRTLIPADFARFRDMQYGA